MEALQVSTTCVAVAETFVSPEGTLGGTVIGVVTDQDVDCADTCAGDALSYAATAYVYDLAQLVVLSV